LAYPRVPTRGSSDPGRAAGGARPPRRSYGTVGYQPTLQAFPLRVNAVGSAPPPGAPRNPNSMVWFGFMVPFQGAFSTVTFGPDWLYSPFHNWVICAELGKVHPSSQPLMVVLLLLVMKTWPWKPAPQSLMLL